MDAIYIALLRATKNTGSNVSQCQSAASCRQAKVLTDSRCRLLTCFALGL